MQTFDFTIFHLCWSVVAMTSTHSLTVLAWDRVHARAQCERSRDGWIGRPGVMHSKGFDGRRIYGSCAVMASHLTTGKLHR
jgi:hypothetical protein